MLVTFFQGFGVGGSLIVAIGAQNAFVLAQGVRRNYRLLVALICSFCDAALILVGVSGVGAVVAANPALSRWAAWGGALFLGWYGFLALKSAFRGGSLSAEGAMPRSLRAILATTFAVSLLNPHVYLDTVVLLGGISGQLPETERLLFAAGAMTASFAWFFTLSFAGGLLAPVFRKQQAWRLLDSLVCLTMWGIAAVLIRGQI